MQHTPSALHNHAVNRLWTPHKCAYLFLFLSTIPSLMTSTIEQDFVPLSCENDIPRAIRVHKLTSREWGLLTEHLCDEAVPVCGVSLRLSKEHGGVDAMAVSSTTDVFHIKFPRDSQRSSYGMSNVARVLDNSISLLAGFGMARLALHLHKQSGLHVEGVDLATLFMISGSKKPQTAAEFASRRIHPDVNKSKIHSLWYGDSTDDLCLRAWLSAVLAQDSLTEVRAAQKVRTWNLPDVHLECLSQLVLNVELLEAERPTHVDKEFEAVEMDANGQFVIRNARYNTRVRRSKQTSVIMESVCGKTIVGHAVRSDGKQTGVKVTGGNFRVDVASIRVVGREELTHAELARDEFILLLLQGVLPSLVDSPYIKMLWFDTAQANRRVRRPSESNMVCPRFPNMNQSQKEVVAAMLSGDEPLVIVHGPPGTGKTTTIAAALDSWQDFGWPAWVIAQSNVGVKNIARTLLKKEVDFRLLVSKEFYVEWHEHLYEEIEERLIRSDELFADRVEAERKLAGVTVVLCTISMLSNPAIDNCGIFRLVPIERLVVDEASQIDTFEFMHLFHKFRSLEKVCMFGDPKQLPPYGKETAAEMKTIYDFIQFKGAAYFLNTQYRMPVPLGDFISEQVYDSKLKSVHEITDRGSVCLIDVRKGREEPVGSSWKVSRSV
ncbi:P-loop containing nucleoside triphosphate hydrolase protein [Pilatotrama ljubarskyi]|nr:P-loop containing nucleoside triphosphate hydrolase protein [Pilatotrama ljubarskyi]